MRFDEPLIAGKILKRYKRFLADVELPDGNVVTAHCPNSGSMKTCWAPGWDARISDSRNDKRKLRHTLEMVHNGICWIGVNTMIPNRIAFEAIAEGRLPKLANLTDLRREVKYGANSRIDILGADRDTGQLCYIEVKNVTLVFEPGGRNEFPDAVTERGRKHLTELTNCVRDGHRAVMLFVIQRGDGVGFAPAWGIDPAYGAALSDAAAAGVEVLACQATVTPECIELTGETLECCLAAPDAGCSSSQ